ncbi:MAG: SusC/RagA family TonB-linked outer membrane protein [Zunongwangia sp.]|uniref:SusC/RagA family TonB-linked outer membrane protein n=2 Tax=Zunongwangia TaxID=417127 RepID=UPI002357F258|tara:strand:- start:1389 stop:4427 length:3039 start_codon:yes stop_codon:yes gene_type:complete
MIKKIIFSFLLVLGLTQMVIAQSQTVKGTITEAETKMPLPGVTVMEKGTSNGTSTDFDGNFSLEVGEDATLVFSMIGYVTQEIPVTSDDVNVEMATDTEALDEVVVTALGIKRESKALSYASQTLGSEEVTKGKNVNFAQGLNGKVAGVQIRQGTAGAGSSTKIQLRGAKNITSSNQPLFVIDGIPMANYQTSDANGFYGGRDSGDGLSNINPEDIASVTVLRGANAAALYGSQGANGVILITTKQGEEGKTRINISSTTQVERVYDYPDLQFRYGATGEPGADSSWGEPGNYKNYVDDFFDTGITLQNAISLSGGNDKTTTYFSYANTHSNGTMPTNEFNKNNLTFKQTSKFFDDKVKVSSNVLLTDQRVDNKMLNGYYFNPLLGLYTFPRGLDFDEYATNYQVLDPQRNIMTQNWPILGNSEANMNPYWILNNTPNTERTKRFIGNASIEYKISDALTLTGRGSYDFTRQIYEQKVMAGSSPVVSSDNGRYVYENVESWQAYTDMILTYDQQFGENWDFHGLVGAAYQKRIIGDGISVDSNTFGLYAPNEFTIQNITQLQAFTNAQSLNSRLVKQSVFANASIGFKDMVFLDVSARNDWASTLSFTDNSSYLYPSAGITFLPSAAFELPEFISYTKVRASFAQVANEVPAFRTNPINSPAFNQISFNNTQPFTELKPEIQDNWEFGADFRFFNSRVNLSATYYQIDSRDQFLPLQAILGTVWQTYYVNAGHVRNYGVELTLGADIFKNDDFTWNSTFNFTHNDNEILELTDELNGQRNSIVGGGGEGYDTYIVKGGSLGDIYVNAYTRDENGNIVVSDDGIPVNANTTEGMKLVGNANPDFMLGWNNSMNFNNFSLSFLIDSRFGGKFVSQTEAYLDALGVTEATANARDAGGVQVDGVLNDGTPYSGVVDARDYYTGVGGRNGIKERYVYDATNIRLRQFTLGYNFSFDEDSFMKNLNVSLVGNNLFFFYNDAPTDPDFAISTGNGTQAVTNFGPPITRNFGLNLSANF